MIEFFKLLNTCSPLRASVYMLFTLIGISIIFNGLSSIINMILYTIVFRTNKKDDSNKE